MPVQQFCLYFFSLLAVLVNNPEMAGCGPTCMFMVLFYLTRDESLTPDKAAEYSMQNGYYVEGSGDFTLSGHFIVIYGYDSEGFMINDPNCIARSSKSRLSLIDISTIPKIRSIE